MCQKSWITDGCIYWINAERFNLRRLLFEGVLIEVSLLFCVHALRRDMGLLMMHMILCGVNLKKKQTYVTSKLCSYPWSSLSNDIIHKCRHTWNGEFTEWRICTALIRGTYCSKIISLKSIAIWNKNWPCPFIIILLKCISFSQWSHTHAFSGGFTWVFNAQLFFNEHYPDFNPGLWLTLCTIFGGTLGLLFGGYLSDMAVRSLGLHSRLWILALTSFVAAPLSVGVLVMDTPYNFTFLLLYFFFGEFRKAC